MYDKPVIGINLEVDGDRRDQAGYLIGFLERWLSCIERAGGIPLIVRPSGDETDTRQLLGRLDGFVLAAVRDGAPEGLDPPIRRSAACPELLLAKAIAARRLPCLGIGLGIQMLALACGGSLRRLDGEPASQAAQRHPHNPCHPVWTTPGSLLDRLYGGGPIMVRSEHAWAVCEAPPGFAATARCAAGVVEAIESTDPDWFAVGVQFLPEPGPLSNPELLLFEALLDEVLAAAGEAAPARKARAGSR
jgi:putative glutamine amidotransferase